MTFLRVVEVFPPLIRTTEYRNAPDLGERVNSFVNEVRRIKEYADLVLVANLRDPQLTTVSTVSAAALLKQRAGVDAAPVIVARDANQNEIASTILGAYAWGLGSLMLAWGDRRGRGARNVYDFASLSSAISKAEDLAAFYDGKKRILAPVNIDLLSSRKGLRLAKSRISAGADLLLAQPPTSDSNEAMDAHLALLDDAGIRKKVLLGVFPFRDLRDIVRCERLFGWRLPPSLKGRADSGSFSPIDEARAVVRRLRKEGLPGVYLSTRGSPDVARQVLG